MGTVSVYCFVKAQNQNEARYIVNVRLGDYMRREFYDGFEVQNDTGDIQPLSNIPDDYFTAVYTASQDLLQQLREEAEEARKTGNRVGEARAMRHASGILYEDMCVEMPWFNMEAGDFSLPLDKQGWWAVMTDFYY
jgi:hypothetical protein